VQIWCCFIKETKCNEFIAEYNGFAVFNSIVDIGSFEGAVLGWIAGRNWWWSRSLPGDDE
jgi:hypothetical protein